MPSEPYGVLPPVEDSTQPMPSEPYGVLPPVGGSTPDHSHIYNIQTISSTCHIRYTNHRGDGVHLASLIQVPTAKWNLPIIANTNITGALSNKRPEIKILYQSFHYDIFCMTETQRMFQRKQ